MEAKHLSIFSIERARNFIDSDFDRLLFERGRTQRTTRVNHFLLDI